MNISNHTKQIALAGFAAIGLAAAAMGAHADEDAAPTRIVRYADLNLNTPAGAAVLYKRIKNAAEQLCGDVNSRRLQEAMAAKACIDHVVYLSVQSVNNLRLTNEYNAHVGVKNPINVASLR